MFTKRSWKITDFHCNQRKTCGIILSSKGVLGHMDTFVEQIIVKRKTGKEIAVIVGTLAVAVIAAVVLFYFLFIYSLLFDVILGYGAWWLITNQNVEYEYSLTNGDIDIDQITAQRKRKRVVSVAGSKIESAGIYDPAAFTGRKFDRTVMAAPSPYEEGVWYFTYRSKKNGSTLVLFQPEERVLSAFQESLPKLLQLDLKRKAVNQAKAPADTEE